MDNLLFQQYIIEDRSYVSFVKREIHNLVKPVFSEIRTGEIDIVVSELTSNLIKHAQKGELLYRFNENTSDGPLFELICIDNGSGIKDLVSSMKDGSSSKNTLGQGLGAISRLSNLAQFYTLPDWGTIIYAKFYSELDFQPTKTNLNIACLNVAMPGEKVCGDGTYVRSIIDKTLIMVGDGLGHGPHAKEAVDTAITSFKESIYFDPSEILRNAHIATKRTRGLVAVVANIDHKNKTMQLCGIGNIYCRIQKGLEFKNYIGNNGVIGMNIPGRLENANFVLEKPLQIIFCSDGIKTKWDLVRYAGISKYDPMILAAVLYKDYARQTDDMTILIVKVT